MTGYTVHTGASKKFVDGWDRIFGGADGQAKAGRSKKTAASTKKAAAKKSAGAKAKRKS